MAGNTENTILEVARKHFVQNGFSSTRMQEIADEAGINKAMLHYYFRSKEKLYQEIIVRTLDTVIPTFANAMQQEGTFWEKIEKLVDTYIDTLIARPEIPFFIMSELSQKQESFIVELKKRSEFFPAIQSLIAEMTSEMEKGTIRTISPVHLFLNIMGMTVFPFMAKPIFCTVFDFPDPAFEALMIERKVVILDFIKNALRNN